MPAPDFLSERAIIARKINAALGAKGRNSTKASMTMVLAREIILTDNGDEGYYVECPHFSSTGLDPTATGALAKFEECALAEIPTWE